MSVHIEYRPEHPNNYRRFNLSCINTTIKLVKTFLGRADPLNPQKILDIGCGRGEIMKKFSENGYKCSGIDFDIECVKMCQQYGIVKCCDISEVNQLFDNCSFDVIILSHVLEHVPNPVEIIEKIKFISSKYILIAVPNLSSTTTFYHGLRRKNPLHVNKGHKCGWDPGHFKTFLEIACNLKIVRWEPERVIIPSKLYRLFEFFSLLDYFEVKVLPKYFPMLSNSLVVLCEVNR